MSYLPYFVLALGIVSLGIFICLRVKKGGIPALLAKAVTSIFFMATALTGLLRQGTVLTWGVPIILGLLFGLVGDIILDARVVYPKDEDTWQWAGMVAFLIGHILFLIAIFTHMPPVGNWFWGIVLIPAAGAIIAACINTFAGPKMGLNYGQFKPICLAYAAVGLFLVLFTIAVAIFSGGQTRWVIMAVGAFLFIASDMILSQQYFGPSVNLANPAFVIPNFITYYAAQFLIAVSVMY
jgi:uncharacterized membrane protein YhhN